MTWPGVIWVSLTAEGFAVGVGMGCGFALVAYALSSLELLAMRRRERKIDRERGGP